MQIMGPLRIMRQGLGRGGVKGMNLLPWPKDIISWKDGANTLFISVPFSWFMDKARRMASYHNGPVLIGGPGTMTRQSCPGYEPIALYNRDATFTTRGCPNRCPFCAVPILEGDFYELPNFRPAPIICDNNLLAASKKHIKKVVKMSRKFESVDFNQGLDARRFTPGIADELGKLKCKIRFAFDHASMESKVADAVALCKKRATKNIGVYVLIGFNDTPEDAIFRLELVRSWGIWPNPMRYQPLDAKKKNDYVAPGWTDAELKRMSRYYSRLRYIEHIPYKDFSIEKTEQGELFHERAGRGREE